jgi:hypothetical protein
MCAVEAADPEMYDGGYQGGTVVTRPGDTVAECLQGGVGERNAELRILHDSPLSPPDGTPKKGVLGSVGSTGRAHGQRARKRRRAAFLTAVLVPGGFPGEPPPNVTDPVG